MSILRRGIRLVAGVSERLQRKRAFRPGDVVDFQGIRCILENPKGSTRSGTDPAGTRWSVVMPYHYGYTVMAEGIDGDKLDVCIGPITTSGRVFLVHQKDPESGATEELKVMLGYPSAKDARAAFDKGYTKKGFRGPMEEMSLEEFKRRYLGARHPADAAELVKGLPLDKTRLVLVPSKQNPRVKRWQNTEQKAQGPLASVSDDELRSWGRPSGSGSSAAMAREQMVQEAILRLPDGPYLVATPGRAAPALTDVLAERLGWKPDRELVEKVVRGLANTYPESVAASLTQGLEEVLLSNRVEKSLDKSRLVLMAAPTNAMVRRWQNRRGDTAVHWVKPVQSLIDLPHYLYHGSRDLDLLLQRGIHARPCTDFNPADVHQWSLDPKHLRLPQTRAALDQAGRALGWNTMQVDHLANDIKDNTGRRLPETAENAALRAAASAYADAWRDYRRHAAGRIAWGPHVRQWFDALPPAGKASLEAQIGRQVKSDEDLRQTLALYWCARDPEMAFRFGVGDRVARIDTDQLSLYGWFDAEMAGEGEVVLVMPRKGPQSPRSAIQAVAMNAVQESGASYAPGVNDPVAATVRIEGSTPSEVRVSARRFYEEWMKDGSLAPAFGGGVRVMVDEEGWKHFFIGRRTEPEILTRLRLLPTARMIVESAKNFRRGKPRLENGVWANYWSMVAPATLPGEDTDRLVKVVIRQQQKGDRKFLSVYEIEEVGNDEGLGGNSSTSPSGAGPRGTPAAVRLQKSIPQGAPLVKSLVIRQSTLEALYKAQLSLFPGMALKPAPTNPTVRRWQQTADAPRAQTVLPPSAPAPAAGAVVPAKEAWQMTRAEFQRAQNGPVVEAVQAMIRSGNPAIVTTQLRVTRLVDAAFIRLSPGGTVQTREGTKWVALTQDMVDRLAAQAGLKVVPFEERVYHHRVIEDAREAGKPIPAVVQFDYPDLFPKVDLNAGDDSFPGITHLTVYRIGSAEGGLERRNASDLNGITSIVRDRILGGQSMTQGDTLSTYTVDVHGTMGAYQAFSGKAPVVSGQQETVGESINRNDSDRETGRWYSFPSAETKTWEARQVASVPIQSIVKLSFEQEISRAQLTDERVKDLIQQALLAEAEKANGEDHAVSADMIASEITAAGCAGEFGRRLVIACRQHAGTALQTLELTKVRAAYENGGRAREYVVRLVEAAQQDGLALREIDDVSDATIESVKADGKPLEKSLDAIRHEAVELLLKGQLSMFPGMVLKPSEKNPMVNRWQQTETGGNRIDDKATKPPSNKAATAGNSRRQNGPQAPSTWREAWTGINETWDWKKHPKHWQEQIEHLSPDLLRDLYNNLRPGGQVSSDPMSIIAQATAEAFQRIRGNSPQTFREWLYEGMARDPQALLLEIQHNNAGDYSPTKTHLYQDLGRAVLPGIRLQDAEEVGRVYLLKTKGEVTEDEWSAWVKDMKDSGKVEST